MTQRFLLANSVCEGLKNDFEQKARLELVRAIAGINEIPGSSLPQASQIETK